MVLRKLQLFPRSDQAGGNLGAREVGQSFGARHADEWRSTALGGQRRVAVTRV